MSFFKALNRLQDKAVKVYKDRTRDLYKDFLEGLAPLVKKPEHKEYIAKGLNDIAKKQEKEADEVLETMSKRYLNNKREIKKIMKERWSDVHYSDRIWKEKKKLKKILLKEIKNGVDVDKKEVLIRKISKKLDTSIFNAERLINTELTNVMAKSMIKSAEIYGKKHYKIGVVMDDRTSDVCKDIYSANEIYKLSEARTGVNLPPFHVSCRSRVIIVD